MHTYSQLKGVFDQNFHSHGYYLIEGTQNSCFLGRTGLVQPLLSKGNSFLQGVHKTPQSVHEKNLFYKLSKFCSNNLQSLNPMMVIFRMLLGFVFVDAVYPTTAQSQYKKHYVLAGPKQIHRSVSYHQNNNPD